MAMRVGVDQARDDQAPRGVDLLGCLGGSWRNDRSDAVAVQNDIRLPRTILARNKHRAAKDDDRIGRHGVLPVGPEQMPICFAQCRQATANLDRLRGRRVRPAIPTRPALWPGTAEEAACPGRTGSAITCR